MRRPWTKAEDRRLSRLYATNSAAECAALMGRTVSATQQRVSALGLSKSEEWVAERARQRWAEGRHDNSRKGHFRKGAAPVNKGRPQAEWMSAESRRRCSRTQFKKGRPAREARNYKPVGALRVCADGYLERKVTDDHPVPARRWVGVHRLVWEAANGPIPPGHAVVFRAGCATTVEAEITLDRLELVTRGDLMRRNSYHTRYPKEVAQLIQLKGALNRKINRRAREASAP